MEISLNFMKMSFKPNKIFITICFKLVYTKANLLITLQIVNNHNELRPWKMSKN
jgi:hypothetical protein